MYLFCYLGRVRRIGVFSFHTLCQTLLLLGIFSFPASASQIWEGTGRVISGVGEGGSVDFLLEVDGEIVRSLWGPPLYGKIQTSPNLNGTIQTKSGTWQIEQCGEQLCINFQQYNPKQTVFYRLQPKQLWRKY